jgi:LytS/YehU family sensor histidine kinase
VNIFFRYKLHHLLFWAVYHYCWWAIALGNPVKTASVIFYSPLFIKYIFYVAASTVSVCCNLYVLMPRYLEKNRIVVYIAWLSGCIVVTSALIVPGYYLTAAAMHSSVRQVYQVSEPVVVHLFFGNSFPATLASMTLGMSIKLTNDWIQARRRQQLLEKERLETELKFLKYQFNPHFLFNTINSIFFLIHKNPDKASASLAKFSELLRHQLYECNDIPIALDKEVAYLENFIQLQRLRQNDSIEVHSELPDSCPGDLSIAPFILMTFVENAFKHVSDHADQPNWIRIGLETHSEELLFSVSNSCSTHRAKAGRIVRGGSVGIEPGASGAIEPGALGEIEPGASGEMEQGAFVGMGLGARGSIGSEVPGGKALEAPGGIGLGNVRRRLDLLYPGRYSLDIQDNHSSFEVRLRLQLSQHPINSNYAELCYS